MGKMWICRPRKLKGSLTDWTKKILAMEYYSQTVANMRILKFEKANETCSKAYRRSLVRLIPIHQIYYVRRE